MAICKNRIRRWLWQNKCLFIAIHKAGNGKNIYKEAEIKDYDDALEYVLSQEKIDETKRNVIVSHQFVTGAMRSESEEVSVGGLDNVSVENYEAFDYVALGHIHRAQQMGRKVHVMQEHCLSIHSQKKNIISQWRLLI